METFEFINRHGDRILFKKEGQWIQMIGGQWFRYFEDAVDPSGGPFIQVGMDLEEIHSGLKGVIVERVEVNGDEIKLKVNETIQTS